MLDYLLLMSIPVGVCTVLTLLVVGELGHAPERKRRRP